MKLNRLISALTLPIAMVSLAATPPGRIAITPAQIANAITGAGVSVSAEQVTLLSNVSAATAAPALEVQSMVPWGDQRMRVRLACAASEQCLPFFVAVSFTKPSAAQADTSASDHSSTAALSASAGNDPQSFAVRSGSRATLLLDGGHVHIRLVVVCLEAGAAGQTIRVSSLDHRQTYRAKVVGDAILRASL